MNRPLPLSPDARRLLELGSHVEPPTPAQNERMDRALAPMFQSGRAAPAPEAGSPVGGGEQPAANPRGAGSRYGGDGERSALHSRPSPRTTPRWLEPTQGMSGSKLWLALGALAATAGASFWLGRLSSLPNDTRALDVQLAASAGVAPAAAAPPLPDAISARQTLDTPGSFTPSSVPPSSVTASSVAQSPLTPSPVVTGVSGTESGERVAHEPSSSSPIHASLTVEKRELGPRGARRAHAPLGLAAEIEQLARAEAALRQGRAAHALLVLEERPSQHLLEQAAALRAIAECELQSAVAVAEARDVLARWPASPFQPRIVHACRL